MLNSEVLVTMLALPFLATLAPLLLLWIPQRNSQRKRDAIPAFAVTLGFLVGFWIVVGRPVFPPPIDAKAQLPFIGGLALLVALISFWYTDDWWTMWIPRLGLSVASVFALLRAPVVSQWSAGESGLRIGALAIGMSVTIWSADALERRVPTRTAATCLAIVAGLGAPVMLFSDSLIMAQLHGTLGMTVATLSIVTWIAPSRLSLTSVSVVVTAISFSLWILCFVFANLPGWSYGLLCLALPAGVTASELIPESRPVWRKVGSVAVTFAFVGGSLSVAGLRYMSTSQELPADSGGSDYGYDY